jgi:hypothetical protein
MGATHASTAPTERHFTGTETVRDIVIGMSDGLTVQFALAAGARRSIRSDSSAPAEQRLLHPADWRFSDISGVSRLRLR